MLKMKELTGSDNPFNGFTTTGHSAPAFTDIDGDGDLDVFVGQKTAASRTSVELIENQGNGKFVEVKSYLNPFHASPIGGLYTKPTFVDIDGDGDEDAFVGTRYGATRIEYYQNDNGNFTRITGNGNPLNRPGFGQSYSAPTFADVDGDGDKDAFIGSATGRVTYLQNNGGSFKKLEGTQNPLNAIDVGTYSTPTFTDIDKDGDLDAFIGNKAGLIQFFKNDGGTFTHVKGEGNPFDGFDVGTYSAPTFADIDGDGDEEAVIGSNDGTLRVFEFGSQPTTQRHPGNVNLQTPESEVFAIEAEPQPTSGDIIGTSGKDYISENANGRNIFGLDGDDTLYNRGGTSTIYGGAGNDKIKGYKQSDLIYGGVGDDRILGNGGSDTLIGEAGNDRLTGSDGDDLILGGVGNDRIAGEGGNDTIYGGAGNDTISGSNSSSNQLIHGDDGNDKIFAKSSNGIIYGGAGEDTIYGSYNEACIDGGADADLIILNSGKESVFLRQGDGGDTIRNFNKNYTQFDLVGGLTYGDLSFEQNGNSADILANNEILATVESTTVDILSNPINFSVI
ncbi:MAG: VCBS repeat-containing protein [Rivularia sp. (in: Bacteria)]|nr:VCBS repeat-containing protein [Rivularia sp. MS3]